MSNPDDLPDHTAKFIKKLSPEDIETLDIVISVVKTAQGWCRFNKWIFHILLLGAAYFIITTSQAFDTISKWLGGWRH